MNLPSRPQLVVSAVSVLRSPAFAQALTLTAIGMLFLSHTVRGVMGWPALIAGLVVLVLLAAASITLRRGDTEWRGLLPISLLVFLGWSGVSILFTEYQWAALGSVLYQFCVAFLAVYIALTRDLIQIVRAFGDVLRVVLAASLVIEVIAGILLDTPVRFLNIAGALDVGGPIQGLLGTRNQLGLVAVMALVTFVVELLSRSVPTPVAVGSIALASLAILFTQSPVTYGVLLVTSVAAGALVLLRRVDATARRAGQVVLLVATVIALLGLLAGRGRVVALLNAGSEFEVRYGLWQRILSLTPQNTLEGFGWIGWWRRELPPYIALDSPFVPRETALNAYIDVLLQLGLVGLCAFIALMGLAFVRSWLLAANKRSIVYLWLALMLTVLVSISFAESSVLVEFGWLTLVICAIKASQDLSWRARLPETTG
ncbi:O-antigen ligase family protein [Marisediminicola senii]|uniref:O-antigen ligase family protein n=1 Tax=Marisediminicola senii TaxID=2711233 RepID=UPI0013EC3148|nr:O-antigen ligase family protein [Marisediminicola senii]